MIEKWRISMQMPYQSTQLGSVAQTNLALHKLACVSVVVASLIMTACASTPQAPLSYIEGKLQTHVDPYLYSIYVVSVDGARPVSQEVPLEAGVRWLVLEAAPSKSALGRVQKSVAFPVAICTRYYLAAKRESPMQADWELVIERQEKIIGCKELTSVPAS
jgi:hypothetical protein